ncbi:hypothetical protein [Rubripirellula reticaptiva]|uniref:hypothetical protein n=1 Tax=Rubripirellula reticaptiva TaxID=2528013 RepID=UPI0011B38CA0|nr:hypothetical protein [Rubripirellula reticaptiva]
MKLFYVHPDDARWLARWLRGNLCGCLIVAGLLCLIGSDTPNQADRSFIKSVVAMAPAEESPRVVSHVPEGWRRTVNGWEHTSTWGPVTRQLSEWIESQQAREPLWAQRLLASLRDTPPLIFAMCQITAITAVVVFTQRQENAV